MAIRRHLARPWTGPSVYDDAIDWTATPRAEYVASRDPALVRCYPGEQATQWTLRPLRQSEVAHLRDYVERGEASTGYMRAFLLSCTACSDPEYAYQTSARGDRFLSDESAELVPEGVWLELGSLALQRAEVGLGEGRRYTLPRGSPPIPVRQRPTTAGGATDSGPAPRSGSSSDASSPPTA